MDLFGGFGGPFDFNGDGMMDPEELAVAMDCLDGDETGDLDSEAEDSSAFMPASLYGKEIEFGEETERNFEVFDMKKIFHYDYALHLKMLMLFVWNASAYEKLM